MGEPEAATVLSSEERYSEVFKPRSMTFRSHARCFLADTVLYLLSSLALCRRARRQHSFQILAVGHSLTSGKLIVNLSTRTLQASVARVFNTARVVAFLKRVIVLPVFVSQVVRDRGAVASDLVSKFHRNSASRSARVDTVLPGLSQNDKCVAN